jgi:hypothetical protein
MDAAQVAGLLVLLGVVGVLAAIVGSGIQAGPVKFPSIPSSRQKLLAVTSVAVAAGGIVWSLSQRDPGGNTASATTTFPKGGLRVILIPNRAHATVGDDIVVTSSVDDGTPGGGLGYGQCAINWRDVVGGALVRQDTTECQKAFTEPHATKVGVHHISANVEAMAGATGTGTRTVDVTVTR